MPRSIQPALTGGEISPALHSRVDLARYQSSLSLCKNFFVHSHGGVSNRPGFEYVGETADHTTKTRVIPFEFNTEQTYMLMFSDQNMRVIKDGGLVLEPSVNVSGATQANPVVITTSASHGYSNGDIVYLSGLGGMTEVNGKYFEIANVASTTFELVGIDGTSYTAYTSGGTSGKLFELTTPYLEADLFDLKFEQSADVMTIAHPDYQQRELTRTDHHVWSLTAISFSILLPPVGLGAAEGGTGTSGTVKTYRYKVTRVVGPEESAASGIASLTTATYSLSATRYSDLTWTQYAGADYYNVYKENSTNSGIFGFIGEAQQDASPNFRDYNFGPDMSVTPPEGYSPFSGSNWPGCVAYHQQRLFFAGSTNNPQTVWGSQSSTFNNFSNSRPTRDTDGIEFTINSKKVNEIRHMVSLDDLILFTSGGVWLVAADQDGVLTPSNINPRKQGGYGCSNVPPIVIGETALYVQRSGKRIRDINYTFETDKYVGNDITIMAEHLFEDATVVDWCYAESPHSLIWVVMSDGRLLSLAYLKEHQVWGWSQHETDGTFESVASITEGDEDIVYAVVNRTINGVAKRYVERLKERSFTDIRDAFFVDSGLTYTGATYTISGATQADPVVITSTGHSLNNGDTVWLTGIGGMTELNGIRYKVANKTANTFEITTLDGNDIDGTGFTAYTSGGTAQYATKNISGLDHLEGKAVVALADGNAVMSLAVASGAVTLPDAASVVHIGLSYNSDIQSLDINYQGETVQSRKKAVGRLALAVRDTRGLSGGITPDDLYEIKERVVADAYGSIPATTGQQIFEMAGDWTDGGRVYIRQAYPLPATILALIPEVVISG